MTEDNNVLEVNEENLPAYRVYTKYQIILTIMADIFCMFLVAAITFVIMRSGNDKLVWLYLIPMLAYVFG